MKNLNVKIFVHVVLFISGFLWISIALLTNVELSKLSDIFLILPKVAVIDLILIAVFIKWAWKFKIFQGWLVPFPNLSGTWEGYMQTTWVNPQSPGPLPVMLIIKQSFGKIYCVMRTSEMTSFSFAEKFILDNNNQIRQLSYGYTDKPNLKVSDCSAVHDGAIAFQILDTTTFELKGRYWTSQKTTGEINLKFLSRDHLDKIPDDTSLYLIGE